LLVQVNDTACFQTVAYMTEINGVFWFIQVFILLLGVAIGNSYILYKVHREENRKRELELALIEKRSDLLSRSKQVAHDLEEALYNAKVQQEIDDILRKN
jgi:hypothetical protein